MDTEIEYFKLQFCNTFQLINFPDFFSGKLENFPFSYIIFNIIDPIFLIT